MIGLNTELEQREASGRPVRVGLIGAGQMGTDVVATTHEMKGVRVVVTADLDIDRARDAYRIGQIEGEVVVAGTAAEADAAVEAGKYVAVADYRIVTDMRSHRRDAGVHRRARDRRPGGAALGPQRPGPGHDERRDRHHRGPDPALVRQAEGRALRARRR